MSQPWQSSAWIEVGEEPEHRIVLRICGALDATSRPVIEPAVLAALASAPWVVLDLTKLTFCDSQGIAMFIGARGLEIAGVDTMVALAN
jgi:anti-anti-sigma factor